MRRNAVLGVIGLLFVLIISSYGLFFRSQKLMVQAETEAMEIAEKAAHIQKAEDFYWYNGKEETYFTVEGYNPDQELLYVVIKQNGGDTSIFSADEIVTAEEAKSIVQNQKSPYRIMEARIGMEAGEPFWEVSFKNEDGTIGYVLLAAKTGETIREYNHI